MVSQVGTYHLDLHPDIDPDPYSDLDLIRSTQPCSCIQGQRQGCGPGGHAVMRLCCAPGPSESAGTSLRHSAASVGVSELSQSDQSDQGDQRRSQ